MKAVLIVALLVAAVVAVLILMGPRTRVTTIERHRRDEKDEDQ